VILIFTFPVSAFKRIKMLHLGTFSVASDFLLIICTISDALVFLLTGINYSIQSVEQVARLTIMSGCSEDLDEDEWVGDDDDEDKPRVGAMPQRSLHIKTKVKPIPEPSSLFIFSSTNPYE